MPHLYAAKISQKPKMTFIFVKISPFLVRRIKPAEFWFGYLIDINAYYPL